jgi:hypothetical protein
MIIGLIYFLPITKIRFQIEGNGIVGLKSFKKNFLPVVFFSWIEKYFKLKDYSDMYKVLV